MSLNGSNSLVPLSEGEEEEDYDFDLRFAIIMGSVSAFIVIENLLTIAVIVRDSKLRRTFSNHFIASLAFADLTVAALCMPLGIVKAATNRRWLLGSAGCHLWLVVDIICNITSIHHLMVISVDRYYVITKPFIYRSRMSSAKTGAIISILWIIPVLMVLPGLIWSQLIWPESSHQRKCNFSAGNVNYAAFLLLFGVYLPTCVLIFLYYRLYKAALDQRNGIKRGVKEVTESDSKQTITLRLSKSNSTAGTSAAGQSSHSASSGGPLDEGNIKVIQPDPGDLKGPSIWKESQRKLVSISREHKAEQIGLLVGAFLLCWIPSSVTIALQIYCESCLDADSFLFKASPWLTWLHSGVNPVIYFLLNRDFKEAICRLIRCR